MSETKTEYKRVKKWNKSTEKQLLYFVNKEGLKGWELFTRGTGSGSKFTMYHFRKKVKP